MSTVVLRYCLCISHNSTKCLKHKTLSPKPSQFLPPKSLSILKNQSQLSAIHVKKPQTHKSLIFAAQSNFLKVVQTVWKVGKDGIEAGTNLVPDSIPRPIARISVAVVAVTLALFVLKSVVSTAFFVLAMMGLIYFTFIALNKDEGPKEEEEEGGTTSTEDSLEEARRIMKKYK